MPGSEPLLKVDGIGVSFKQRRGAERLKVVDDVSFLIHEGETVALVGESGSGKSTIGNAILGLVQVDSGLVELDGDTVVDAGRVDRQRISENIGVVFQDPYGSLNPSRTIGQTLIEPLMVHRRRPIKEMQADVVRMLEAVGLPPAAADRRPYNFSGGQRQRIAIARAMMIEPRLVVCDEPVSALDLSVQAQVLNLLAELQERARISYLFVSHDLSVVQHVADQVLVLYRGAIVEQGPAAEVCASPRHPYTQALLLAAPVADPLVQSERASARRALATPSSGTFGSLEGCQFSSRCPFVVDRCLREKPDLRQTVAGTFSACHRDGGIPSLKLEPAQTNHRQTPGHDPGHAHARTSGA
jgi:peptide/nickel transport system ATP-binding protein